MASLIKTSAGETPGRAIQFTHPDGKRRTITLGRVGLEPARKVKTKVEALLSCLITNSTPDAEVSAWLAGLSDTMHGKLAAVRLIPPREPRPVAPTLGTWLDKYIGQRTGLKPASRKSIMRTGYYLKEHFGADVGIDQVTANGAADWRAGLLARELSEATVRLHCRNAKAIFNEAVERELIDANPFRKLVSSAIAAARDRYVTPGEAETILQNCPNSQWRTLFALARLAGLRVPSETHILTWADVDWDRGRLSVYSPKTERYEKHRRRNVPVVPELMAILQDAFDAAEPGEERIVRLSRNNLHRTMHAILKRAEIAPWDNCFQALRRSRETEWSLTFPQHAVSAWLGHSEQISRDHYLQVPEEIFDRAAGLHGDSSDPNTSGSAAKSAAANSRIGSQGRATGENAQDVSYHEKPTNTGSNAENGTAPPGTRTPDPLIKSQLLCQLS